MTYTYRYTAYAKAHGRDPEAMLEHDRKRWPGGKMIGFILWIGERWDAFATHVGKTDERRRGRFPLGPDDHAAFDAWLGLP